MQRIGGGREGDPRCTIQIGEGGDDGDRGRRRLTRGDGPPTAREDSGFSMARSGGSFPYGFYCELLVMGCFLLFLLVGTYVYLANTTVTTVRVQEDTGHGQTTVRDQEELAGEVWDASRRSGYWGGFVFLFLALVAIIVHVYLSWRSSSHRGPDADRSLDSSRGGGGLLMHGDTVL